MSGIFTVSEWTCPSDKQEVTELVLLRALTRVNVESAASEVRVVCCRVICVGEVLQCRPGLLLLLVVSHVHGQTPLRHLVDLTLGAVEGRHPHVPELIGEVRRDCLEASVTDVAARDGARVLLLQVSLQAQPQPFVPRRLSGFIFCRLRAEGAGEDGVLVGVAPRVSIKLDLTASRLLAGRAEELLPGLYQVHMF